MRQYALSAPRASCGTAENWNSANFAFVDFSEVDRGLIGTSSPAGNKARGECDAKQHGGSVPRRKILRGVLREASIQCMVHS
jgi:hypothetical protein